MSEHDLRALAEAAGTTPADLAPHASLLAAVREAARLGAMEGRRIAASGLVTAAEARARLRIGEDKMEALRKSGDLPMFRLPDGKGKVGREWYITDQALNRVIERWERKGTSQESKYRRRAA